MPSEIVPSDSIDQPKLKPEWHCTPYVVWWARISIRRPAFLTAKSYPGLLALGLPRGPARGSEFQTRGMGSCRLTGLGSTPGIPVRVDRSWMGAVGVRLSYDSTSRVSSLDWVSSPQFHFQVSQVWSGLDWAVPALSPLLYTEIVLP